MSKLAQDFGVSALIGVIALGISGLGLIVGMALGHISGSVVATAFTAWGGSAVTSFVVLKGMKQAQNGGTNAITQ